jgi:hypothetical protein
MRHYPSLPEIVAAVEALLLPRRKKAPQGRKPRYSDELIIALAVYQHLWRFRYAQDLLYWLRTHGHQVPAPATFCERKAQLLGQVILAVKALAGLYNPAPCLRMDSKKLPTAALARAKRVRLPGRIGRDHANRTYFYGLRLHALVDDQGFLRRVLLYPAHKHDVVVAARLLQGLSYVVVTGDKGYLSRALKAQAARQGVDLIARHKRNMRPHTRREQYFLRGHRMVESVFSSLDRLGLSERPYRKTQGLVFHLYAVLLGYGLLKLMEHNPAWRLLLAQLGGMWLVAFPNWGVPSSFTLFATARFYSVILACGALFHAHHHAKNEKPTLPGLQMPWPAPARPLRGLRRAYKSKGQALPRRCPLARCESLLRPQGRGWLPKVPEGKTCRPWTVYQPEVHQA